MDDPTTDSELVAAVVRGDLDAFAALVRRHRDSYTRFAVRMLGERTAAEDALHDAWLHAHRDVANCREPKRFGAWLYHIVVIECRARLSRQTPRDTRFADFPALATIPDASDKVPPVEEVERVLGELPDEQREAFVLSQVEQMSFEEMAEITGAGIAGLQMRVKRAMVRLRETTASMLRTEERLSAGFESRLLSRVRDEKVAEVQRQTKHPRSWWTTPRLISRTPIASMAMALVFAAVIAMATLLVATKP